MNMCAVGTGYVGLVTGACLAESGMNNVCIGTDSSKIAMPTSCSRNGTNSGGWICIYSKN